MAKSPKITGVHILGLAIVLSLIVVAGITVTPKAHATQITVHKSPTCGCCELWVRHLEDYGFDVTVRNVDTIERAKRALDVPRELYSCHTAQTGNYVVEGHVPAKDILNLLETSPNITGIGVAGMPMGSPGMDSGYQAEPFNVLAFKGRQMKIFASH